MDLVLFLLVLAAVAAWVSAPFRRGTAPPPEPADVEREARLIAIRDAELDARMGKLSPAEHAELDARLRAEALEAMRE